MKPAASKLPQGEEVLDKECLTPPPIAAPLFELNAAAVAPKISELPTEPKKRQPGIEVREGSAVVRVTGRAPGPWFACWHGFDKKTGKITRLKKKFAKHAAVIRFAKDQARDLARDGAAAESFSAADRAEFRLVRERAMEAGQSPAAAITEHSEAKKILAGRCSSIDAARFYMEHQPAGIAPKNIPEIVTEYLAFKSKQEKSEEAFRNLKQKLNLFAANFTGPFYALKSADLNSWIQNLDVGERTRKNYLDAIGYVVRYAKRKHYLDEKWKVLDELDVIEVPLTEIRIYTPAEINRLLSLCRPNLLPLLAITCFAGVRHEEMCHKKKKILVRWENINFKTGFITVDRRASKVKKRRQIKMPPNLIAWIRPYAKLSGPICELKASADALGDLGKRADIPWRKNAPRKSFISYRVQKLNGDLAAVAFEAGNSPGEIDDSYLDLATPEDADKWFNVFPPEPERMVQVNFL